MMYKTGTTVGLLNKFCSFGQGRACEECGKCLGEVSAVGRYEEIDVFDKSFASGLGSGLRGFGIAVDIGTTTLAFELIDLASGARVADFSCGNSQRALGADIISRITCANAGELPRLHAYVMEDIRRGIDVLLQGVEKSEVSRVVIAGNTTMLHFLQNLPCDTLGVYPFTPVSVEETATATLAAFFDCEVLILPYVSAFIGADIVSGIFCLSGSPNPKLLIDLGTNAEIVLFSHNKITATSAAAGPTFEGGNISMGRPSTQGAIAKAKYRPETLSFDCETIGNTPPTGICGTGVIDICSELLRHGLADSSGLLKSNEPVTIAEKVTFTQKDLREVQLAKSAIRTAIEVLLEESGILYENISKVFLAGGFGYTINAENAATIGLLPPQLAKKTQAIGNSSLAGCTKLLLNPQAKIAALASSVEEINLSTHPRFEELFIKHMNM